MLGNLEDPYFQGSTTHVGVVLATCANIATTLGMSVVGSVRCYFLVSCVFTFDYAALLRVLGSVLGPNTRTRQRIRP